MQSKNISPFIRRARTEDAAAILHCLSEAFAPYQREYTPEAFADTVLDRKSIHQRMTSMQLFVAVAQESIVGTIGCEARPPEGHLRGMAVLPSWQGADIAAGLLQAAEDELRARSCSFVTLDTTEPLKRAVRFYEKHGYAASGKVSDFFGMPLYEYRKSL